jgi:hypothetical protein
MPKRWKIYLTSRFRLIPDAGISKRSVYFCGGFHIYWLWFAVEYDHLSQQWNQQREIEVT